jgi:outer membrane protein OmpA-like peptidoglycan-associated protein
MRIFLLIPTMSIFVLTLAGCATPPENANLLQARAQFSTLQSNPAASTLAAVETQNAFSALNKADMLSNQDRQSAGIDQLAYIAQQKTALAEQTILGRQAEAGLSNITAERTQVQLDVRTEQLKALQALNAKSTERGQLITFGDVLFDTGKAELKYGSRNNLQQLATFLAANPERKVRIEGFTDSVGSDAFNLQLSERRADSVAVALTRMGVDGSRLMTQGYGKEYPVADNSTVQSRQLNRRVEVIISNGSSAVEARK